MTTAANEPRIELHLSADTGDFTNTLAGVMEAIAITDEQQSDSRFHIETDAGEYYSSDRKAALRFARKHESAEVWEIDGEDLGERIYWAEA